MNLILLRIHQIVKNTQPPEQQYSDQRFYRQHLPMKNHPLCEMVKLTSQRGQSPSLGLEENTVPSAHRMTALEQTWYHWELRLTSLAHRIVLLKADYLKEKKIKFCGAALVYKLKY